MTPFWDNRQSTPSAPPSPCPAPRASLSIPSPTLDPQMLPACSLPLFSVLETPLRPLLLVKPPWSKDDLLPNSGILQHARHPAWAQRLKISDPDSMLPAPTLERGRNGAGGDFKGKGKEKLHEWDFPVTACHLVPSTELFHRQQVTFTSILRGI